MPTTKFSLKTKWVFTSRCKLCCKGFLHSNSRPFQQASSAAQQKQRVRAEPWEIPYWQRDMSTTLFPLYSFFTGNKNFQTPTKSQETLMPQRPAKLDVPYCKILDSVTNFALYTCFNFFSLSSLDVLNKVYCWLLTNWLISTFFPFGRGHVYPVPFLYIRENKLMLKGIWKLKNSLQNQSSF